MSQKRRSNYIKTHNQILEAAIRLIDENKSSRNTPSIEAICKEANVKWEKFRYHFKNTQAMYTEAEEKLRECAEVIFSKYGKDIKGFELNVFFFWLFDRLRNEENKKFCELVSHSGCYKIWISMLNELYPMLTGIWQNYGEGAAREAFGLFCYELIWVMDKWIMQEEFSPDLIQKKAKLTSGIAQTAFRHYTEISK